MRIIRKEKLFANFLCLITVIVFFLCAYKSSAQYPVRSQITFIPPYSPNLSDYYTGTTERFVVTLTNTDFANPLRKVRLRLNVKSNAITLRSKDNVYYPIIELDAGIPIRLSLSDLAPYFNANNIDASGVDYNFLSKNPRLPDGYYSFRFDVIDANTGQVLNNILLGEQNIRITNNDPPLLNLPRNKDNIAFKDPTNIIFNWTPRHIGISSAEYEFSLYEINDNGMPPENAPFVSQPIYQTTIYTTTLLYGPTEPQLLPGKRYAWRIKATAMSGGDAYDLFRNNGYSETYWFQLNDNCPSIQQVAATVKNGAVTISWLDNPQMYEYTVEYRKIGNATNRWFTTTTRANRVVITNVSENSSYEYRVGGTCTIGAGATFSDVKAFTIPPRDSIRDMQCGIMPNINLSNKTAIDKLNIGDVVNVGDFPVMITDFTSTIGSFSGKGYITIPFLGDIRVKVKFDNVMFNTDKQLIQGFMITTYDKTESQIADIDSIINDIKGAINILKNLLEKQPPDSNQNELYKKYTNNLNQVINNLNDSVKKEIVLQALDKMPVSIDNSISAKDSATNAIQKINDILNRLDNRNQITQGFYVKIDEIKYNNGDTIYFPKSNRAYKVVAYDSTGKVLKTNLNFTNITRLNDSTAILQDSVTSTRIADKNFKIEVRDSGNTKFIVLQYTVVEVKFSEHPNQLWGFDENDSTKENDYPSYRTTPTVGIPIKSIEDNGVYDKVSINVLPIGAEKKIYLTLQDSSNYNVKPKIPISNNQTVELNSITNINETSLIPKVGDFVNDTMQLKVKGYRRIVNKVAVITINEENDDIQMISVNQSTTSDTSVCIVWGNNKFIDTKPSGDDRIIYRPQIGDSVVVSGINKICETQANNTNMNSINISRSDIKNHLNKIHKYGVVKWEVDSINYTKTINYDFDRDGQLYVDYWATREMQRIIDSCGIQNSQYNLFLVDFPNDGSNGFMDLNQKYGFIHTRKPPGFPIPTDSKTSCAHELGHGVFSFEHPHAEFSTYPRRNSGTPWTPKDINNLMDWDGGSSWPRNKLRKYQWDKISR